MCQLHVHDVISTSGILLYKSNLTILLLCIFFILQMACNDQLEWYKCVKETQLSFEVTSFGQMNNIFQYGCYTVGSGTSNICQHYREVIHLILKAKDKTLAKTNYNLEELRDLESKLVLITGSKAENRAQVDIFIDVRVRQSYIPCRLCIYPSFSTAICCLTVFLR